MNARLANLTADLSDLPAGLGAMLASAGGDVAKMRAAQFQRAKLRGLAPLWKNSQEQIDDAVTRIGREGLIVAADRIAMFPRPLPNWLATLGLTSHKVSESRKANRGMVPGSLPDGGGLQDKTPYTQPVYVTWDQFGFNIRELMAAQQAGRPLDTDEVEQSVRNVNFAIEDAVLNGLLEQFGGNASPGMLGTTNTMTFEAVAGKWTAAAKTGTQILADVLSARAVLAADKFYGPYTLYVNTGYGAVIQKPFDTAGQTGLSIQAYLQQLVFGGRNLIVKTADLLGTDQILLVQDTADVCDVIVGQTPTAINPAPEYEFMSKWLVYACIVPRVKSNYSGNWGVCYGTNA